MANITKEELLKAVVKVSENITNDLKEKDNLDPFYILTLNTLLLKFGSDLCVELFGSN